MVSMDSAQGSFNASHTDKHILLFVDVTIVRRHRNGNLMSFLIMRVGQYSTSGMPVSFRTCSISNWQKLNANPAIELHISLRLPAASAKASEHRSVIFSTCPRRNYATRSTETKHGTSHCWNRHKTGNVLECLRFEQNTPLQWWMYKYNNFRTVRSGHISFSLLCIFHRHKSESIHVTGCCGWFIGAPASLLWVYFTFLGTVLQNVSRAPLILRTTQVLRKPCSLSGLSRLSSDVSFVRLL